MSRSRLPSSVRSPEGIALVVTLTLLALITILVVGFTASMRTEHQASHSMAENQRAALVIQSALAHAVSLLSNNIPQPVAPGPTTATPPNWVINPGLLTIITGTGTTPTITRVPLSTNPSATYQPTSADANLNVPVLTGSGGYTLLPTADALCAAWVPVLQNPLVPTGAANPIAARYAFWIDDESARINVNTAVGKPSSGLDFTQRTPGYVTAGSAQYPLGHPGSVNLDVLGALNANSLVNAIAAAGPLTSPEAVKSYVANGDPTAFFNANKFALTAWSRDPEFNVFGKSRFFLTRRMTGQLGVNTPAFQFFRDADAPLYAPTDENKNGGDVQSLYYTAAGLSSLLGPQHANWPGMPAGSFADKWDRDNNGSAIPGAVPGEVGAREADQFAWNLVTLAHFADGSFGSSIPARWTDYTNLRNRTTAGQTGYVGSANRPNSTAMLGALSKKALLPAYPAPMVDEVCLLITPVVPTGINPAPPAGTYWLNVSLRVELWLPPGYSACDLSALGTTAGLTYLSYNVSQGSVKATQTDTKYRDAANGNGISVLYGGTSGGVMDPNSTPAGAFVTLTTTKNFYVRNDQSASPGFSNSGSGASLFTAAGGQIALDFKMRLYAASFSGTIPNDITATRQLIPMWDSRDPGTAPATQTWNPAPPATPLKAFSPPGDDPRDYIEFKFNIDAADLAPPVAITRSLEIADPRESGLARMWVQAPGFNDPTQQDANSLNFLNNATTAAGVDLKKFAYIDFNESSVAYSKPPSIGMISLLPTGMQRGIPGATVRLQPCRNANVLPDWLLLDLIAPTPTALNLGDGPARLSRMNATAGKINLNGGFYPNAGSFVPPARWQPLQALFQNMPNAGGAPSALVNNILQHTLTPGGQDFGAPGLYDYAGKVCEVAGFADGGPSDWDKEVLARNLASTLTTKSNVFSVWGVAQTLRKKPGNTGYGVFEKGDVVTGEKRFQAVVERYVWPGKDGIPGNGHVTTAGTYDRTSPGKSPGQPPTAYTGTSWETLDGPAAPTYPPAGASPGTWTNGAAAAYTNTPIENADNPVGAVMKYRVIYFHYLND